MYYLCMYRIPLTQQRQAPRAGSSRDARSLPVSLGTSTQFSSGGFRITLNLLWFSAAASLTVCMNVFSTMSPNVAILLVRFQFVWVAVMNESIPRIVSRRSSRAMSVPAECRECLGGKRRWHFVGLAPALSPTVPRRPNCTHTGRRMSVPVAMKEVVVVVLMCIPPTREPERSLRSAVVEDRSSSSAFNRLTSGPLLLLLLVQRST